MRVSHRHLLLILVAASIPAACVARPRPAPAGEPVHWRSLVGCYRTADRQFSLDSVPFLAIFSIEEGSRLIRSEDPWWWRGLDAYWRMSAPDSVKLVWADGLHAGYLRFSVRGDSLVGVEDGHTDMPPYRFRPRRVVAVREPCPANASMSPARPDPAREALLSGYFAALPADAQMKADPWAAVAPLHAWLAAHPEVRTDSHFRHNARAMFNRASTLSVRADARELVGTYRLEIERTGGPTHVIYGRTEIQPQHALRSEDTSAVALDQAPGYRLRFTLAGDSSALPVPGPGRRHRQPLGGNTAANSHIDVRLPAAVEADGTRRLRAYVLLVNFGYYFRNTDRTLYEWNYEWFKRHWDTDGPNIYAEFAVSPNGRVTFTQRQVLAPDSVVTLRGERISGDAWQCVKEGC